MPPPTGTRTSTRQGRTTVRPTNYYARSFAGRLAASGFEQIPEAPDPRPGFLPALTHYTGAVDAFPKEMIKHFSMFKEVEAKLHDPEEILQNLLDDVTHQPAVTKAQARTHAQILAGSQNGTASSDRSHYSEQQAITEWRQMLHRLRLQTMNILPILDEKLVVLQSANVAKNKGLARMHHSYSRLDGEISEEARYGSLNHWAYADKEERKKGAPAHERQRREVASANNLAAAAQHVHDVDSIAAKSEARREAMMANKRNRQQPVDSDFDDRPVKKPHKRKVMVADMAVQDGRTVGLGIISSGVGTQGKRKKTEKALATVPPTALPMERSLSSVLKSAGAGGRSGASPRGTPGPENGTINKRKPRAVPAPAPRKHQVSQNSPPPASSPLTASFAVTRAVPNTSERPTSARARKNSVTNSMISFTAQDLLPGRRPSSSHSVQQVPGSIITMELDQPQSIPHNTTPDKNAMAAPDVLETPQSFEVPHTKTETVGNTDLDNMEVDPPARAGRSSKAATPILGTFPEISTTRGRGARNVHSTSNTSSENNSTTADVVSKRGHKKTSQFLTIAGLGSPTRQSATNSKSNHPSSPASSAADEREYPDADAEVEIEEDGDEPCYCYCNEVSYGNMIACDNDGCPREWFHLPCVQLDRVPQGRAKWFCSDQCKEAFANAKNKAKGGRPSSRRQ